MIREREYKEKINCGHVYMKIKVCCSESVVFSVTLQVQLLYSCYCKLYLNLDQIITHNFGLGLGAKATFNASTIRGLPVILHLVS